MPGTLEDSKLRALDKAKHPQNEDDTGARQKAPASSGKGPEISTSEARTPSKNAANAPSKDPARWDVDKKRKHSEKKILNAQVCPAGGDSGASVSSGDINLICGKI